MSKIPMLERFAAQSLVEHDGELIFSKERFAELIVRECAKSADEWYQNHNDIHWDPAQHIKNHFGVEE